MLFSTIKIMSQFPSATNMSTDNCPIYKWNQICRACLGEDITIQPLFNSDSSKIPLSEMMIFCTALQISTDDMFPQQLCTECVEQLYNSFDFKIKCRRSAEKLQQIKLEQETEVPGINIKTEEDMSNEPLCETNVITSNVEALLDEREQITNVNKGEKRQSKDIKLRKAVIIREKVRNKLMQQTIQNKEKNIETETIKAKKTFKKREKKHLCSDCGLRFLSLKRLQSHQASMTHNRIQPGKTIKTCFKCRIHFEDPEEYFKHRKIHDSWLCPDCGRVCRRGSYRAHMLTHSDLRPHICEECGKKYKTERSLKIHLRNHTGERPFTCEKCGDNFITTNSLNYHIQTDHSDERKHVCHFCSMAFLRLANLNIHIKTHTGEKPFPCSECDIKFRTKRALTDHLVTHTGEKKYPCKVCSKLFPTPTAVRKHNARLHKKGEKKHICVLCERGFLEAKGLKRHIRSHAQYIIREASSEPKFSETLLSNE